MSVIVLAVLTAVSRFVLVALLAGICAFLWHGIRQWWREDIVPRGDALAAAQRARIARRTAGAPR